jgi:hypothetical protein
VDKSFYFQQLYPLQDEVLKFLTGLDTGLYLTGGTAASRAYLTHRFSDDLDLFANDAEAFGLWADRLVQGLAGEPDWNLKVAQRESGSLLAGPAGHPPDRYVVPSSSSTSAAAPARSIPARSRPGPEG